MFFQMRPVVQAVIGLVAQNTANTYARAFIQSLSRYVSKYRYNVTGVQILRVYEPHFQYFHQWYFGIAVFSGHA